MDGVPIRGCVLRIDNITREFVRSNRDLLFVFGDNMMRRGLKGQAKEMRYESNAIGIPTKWLPNSEPNAYFCDSDWKNPRVRNEIETGFSVIINTLDNGYSIVIPKNGIGTGHGKLLKKAPAISFYINQCVDLLTEIYKCSDNRA